MTQQEAEIEQVVTAIQRRIDAIRAAVPDVVPGDYQTAFADGMTSAIAEIRAVFRPEPTCADALGHVGCHDLKCRCEHVYPPGQEVDQ